MAEIRELDVTLSLTWPSNSTFDTTDGRTARITLSDTLSNVRVAQVDLSPAQFADFMSGLMRGAVKASMATPDLLARVGKVRKETVLNREQFIQGDLPYDVSDAMRSAALIAQMSGWDVVTWRKSKHEWQLVGTDYVTPKNGEG